MSSTWDMGGERPRIRRIREPAEAAGPRPRRARDGEEAVSPGESRRDQANARILRLVDEQYVQHQADEVRRREGGVQVGALRLDMDGVFAFLLFLPLLFMVQLGTVGAAAVAALVPVYVFVRRAYLFEALWPRLFLFVIPALALFSVVWSEAPKETFRYALQFGLSVMAGLLLSSARDPSAVIKGLALAFLGYVATSVAFGSSVAIGVGLGGYAFSGLSGSKNLLADIAATGLIISIATLMIAVRRRELAWSLLALFAIALDLYVAVAARSAGALLGVGMGAVAMLGLAPLLKVSKAVRAWLTSAVALCLFAAGLSYRWIATNMIEWGAQVFDKDATLTGRTYLWYRAADLIQEKPMLGRGYYAFWLQGNIDAEGLWRYFGIEERGGFTFHNTAVELLVTVGWVGLIIVAAIALIGAVALVKRFVERPSIALVCWISLFLYMLARTPIETIGIAPFYFSTVLAFAALGAAFGRVPAAQQAAHAPRPPLNVVPVRPVDYTASSWSGQQTAPMAARGGLRRLRDPGTP